MKALPKEISLVLPLTDTDVVSCATVLMKYPHSLSENKLVCMYMTLSVNIRQNRL